MSSADESNEDFEWQSPEEEVFAGFTPGELEELEDAGWRPFTVAMDPDNHPDLPHPRNCEEGFDRVYDGTDENEAVVVYPHGDVETEILTFITSDVGSTEVPR